MSTEEEVSNQIVSQQKVLVSSKSHPVNAKMYSDVKFQNEENAL